MAAKRTPRLTAEQRRALDALTPKRRAFVLAYIGEACGVAVEAARIAGYTHPDPEGARLLGDARVRVVVEALRAPAEDRAIATSAERRAFFTAIMRGDVEDVSQNPIGNRIKAGEILAKLDGDFIERREVSGPGGGPIQNEVRAVLMPGPVAIELARDAPLEIEGDNVRALPRGEDDDE